jgi:hypothetical protein
MKIGLVFFLLLFFAPCARGDPLTEQTGAALVAALHAQNELLADRNQLISVGYDPQKTDLAALLESKQLKRYFEQTDTMAVNSTAVKQGVEQMQDSLYKLSGNMDTLVDRLANNEERDGKQDVLINRNTLDISRIFYVVAAVAGFLAAAAWAGHGWAHRNDNRGG